MADFSHYGHRCLLTDGEEEFFQPLPKNAPFSEKVKHRVGKRFLVSHRNPDANRAFRSHMKLLEEKKKHFYSRDWHVIHPYSQFQFFWLSLMTLVGLVFLFVAPISVAKNSVSLTRKSELSFSDLVFIVLDFVFLIDIILQFNTGYLYNMEVVLDKRKVCRRYLKTWFLIDLVSSIPSVLWPATTNDEISAVVHLLDLCSFLKLLRVGRYSEHIEMIFEKYNLNKNRFEFFFNSMFVLMICHWVVLCRIFVEQHDDFSQEIPEDLPKYESYFMIALSYLLAVSNGESDYHLNEFDMNLVVKTFVSVVLLVGVIYTSFTAVRILNATNSEEASSIKHSELMNQLEFYMMYKQLPQSIRRKLLAYYDYTFQGSYYKEQSILDTLSHTLRQEVMEHGYSYLIKYCIMLQNLPKEDLYTILISMKREIFSPTDIILQAGEILDAVFFISHGTLAVYSQHGKEHFHVDDGCAFGLSAVLRSGAKSMATLVALEHCEIFKIKKKDFLKCFPPGSEVHRRIEQISEERLALYYKVMMEEEKSRVFLNPGNELEQTSETEPNISPPDSEKLSQANEYEEVAAEKYQDVENRGNAENNRNEDNNEDWLNTTDGEDNQNEENNDDWLDTADREDNEKANED